MIIREIIPFHPIIGYAGDDGPMKTLILAGGTGTRLFPLSRELYPKQFIPLLHEETLFPMTVKRALQNHGSPSLGIVYDSRGGPVLYNQADYRFTETATVPPAPSLPERALGGGAGYSGDCGWGRDKVPPKGESIFVPAGMQHRLRNPVLLPVELIEVQRGEYIGEDSIVRFDDDFGRA